MQKQNLIRDPNLRRLVQDFDALAGRVQTLLERDRPAPLREETVPSHDTEFTTEWQMEPSAAEAHSL